MADGDRPAVDRIHKVPNTPYVVFNKAPDESAKTKTKRKRSCKKEQRRTLPTPMTRASCARHSAPLCHELMSFRVAVTTWYNVMDANTTTPRRFTKTDSDASRVWVMLVAFTELPGPHRFPCSDLDAWQARLGMILALHERSDGKEREKEGRETARTGKGMAAV